MGRCKTGIFHKRWELQILLNGRGITAQVYHSCSNKLYNKTPQSDTLYWFDASVNTDEVVSYEVIKNKEVVMGINCDAIVLKTKDNGRSTFFYNSKYKVNVALYQKHQYGNWYYMLSKTGALPLKSVIENKQFIMESIATEIKPMKLDDSYFSIEANTPLKKSI